MYVSSEYRYGPRINLRATVMFESRDDGNFHYGTIYNFSDDGMYCGSDFALKPGTAITIRLDKQPFKYASRIYLGEIMRCEEVEGDNNSHLYGLGIKIIKAI